MGPLRGFEPRSAAYETAILPVELQRHASAPKRRFFCFGANTPGPEFRGISRERGRRSLTRHAQGSDRPLGAHTSPRRSGKADHGSRVAQPQGCALAGAARRPSGDGRRQRAGWRRTTGRFRRRAGQPSGVRAAHGGRKRARAGKKAAHAGTSGVPGVCAGAGVPGKTGASRVSIRAHAGQKTGGTGAKRGRSGGQKGGYGGRWGQKSPFLPRKRRATGLCWGENWLRKLAGRVGLFGAFREASGGFGGKS